MHIPKRYGQSRIDRCPFCDKHGVTKNKQDIPVCSKHADKLLTLKCICGNILDICSGKWGTYCRCIKCGNINFKKALEINPKPEVYKEPNNTHQKERAQQKETVVSSKDLDFLY